MTEKDLKIMMTEKDKKIMQFLEKFASENMGNRMTHALAIGLLNGMHQLLLSEPPQAQQPQAKPLSPVDAMAFDPR